MNDISIHTLNMLATRMDNLELYLGLQDCGHKKTTCPKQQAVRTHLSLQGDKLETYYQHDGGPEEDVSRCWFALF